MTQLLAILALALIPSAPENLRVTIVPPAAADPQKTVIWHFKIENVSGRDVPAAPVTFSFGNGQVASLQPDLACTAFHAGAAYRCTLPALAAGQSIEVDAAIQHPFRYGQASGSVIMSYSPAASEMTTESATFWLEFPVTTTADSGPGSLRQTILDINAAPECAYQYPGPPGLPCKAAFRIAEPVPSDGWYTVRPLTPLPSLNVLAGSIDGSTQVASNARGPSVAIDGSLLTFGNGITTAGPEPFSTSEIRGLAIGGFPRHGILAMGRSQLFVRDCYIGVDPTGQRANPNGLRGIQSTVMAGTIVNNVISGNTLSGIFFMGKAGTGPSIRNNRIGVAAHDDTPMGNGASGIFIGDFPGYYAYPTIEGNVIANSAEFGIALTSQAPILIFGNSIRDNGRGGIDIGLDGPTDFVPGVPGVEGGVVPPPVILSATYANGITTIKGFSVAGNNRRQVFLYANSELEAGDYAEGEQFLGKTPVLDRGQTAFTFEYSGDLRGKYINGTSAAVTSWSLDEYSYTSSEFGRAVAVGPE